MPASRLALISNTTDVQAAPIELGSADVAGNVTVSHAVTSPATGEDWYFVVVCPEASGDACGTDQEYTAVTAPIWFVRSP